MQDEAAFALALRSTANMAIFASRATRTTKKKRSLVVSSILRLLQCIKCTDHLAVGIRRVLRLHVQRRQHALCLHVPLVDVRAVKDSQQKQISEQEPGSHACASRRTKTLRKPNRLVTDSVIGCKGLLLLSLFEPRISLLFVLLGALQRLREAACVHGGRRLRRWPETGPQGPLILGRLHRPCQ
jgi:hypothetical protein